MNFSVFAPKYPISAQFGYNFSRQTVSGAGIACFCHSLVTSLTRAPGSLPFLVLDRSWLLLSFFPSDEIVRDPGVPCPLVFM